MGYRLKANPHGSVSREVFVRKLKELDLMFPTWKMDLSNRETITLLYKHLGYCKNERFESGIDKYIGKEVLNPTVAALKKYINSIDKRDCVIKMIHLYELMEDGVTLDGDEAEIELETYYGFSVCNGLVTLSNTINGYLLKSELLSKKESEEYISKLEHIDTSKIKKLGC